MKKSVFFSEWILGGVMLLPLIYLAFIYNRLPATVPMHYDSMGTPNRYDSKETFVTIFGIMTLFMYLLFRYIPALDPKQKLETANYYKMRLLIAVFWAVLLIGIGYTTTQGLASDRFLSFLTALVCLMLAGVGNLMYSVRHNYFVGIRTPWTLDSEVVWRKTHQRVAPIWVAVGLLGTILAFLLPTPWKSNMILIIALGLALGSAGYSYLVFRQEKAKQTI
ncbi:SdpI family protein [Tellurirhabdus bombi]|uniref:SdpI family protein n=1 Tax=Tellurirhabdus bombi TaxID=2907205 RepID=UPI001F3A8ECC|nr:SdpI family protein [Tellurirhabdus bombi]